ncbi:BI1-like protein isoform X1 [Rhodamnia argentea]|uniref:BI1-like protein isoform X1 n=1 Tax=Rhodamnia argentea TaxID=178133 RepID=A0ABM3GZ31_9MYRT|nr:BI1-like protein isoform X1 [Rhodamnia argentea]
MDGYARVGKLEKDLELGNGETLYPGLSYGENQLRWGFIRKVYGILAAQIVLTTVVSSVTVLYAPVNDLLRGNSGLLLFLMFLPLLLLWPLHIYQQKHPLNFVFLGLFTLSLSLTVGVSCANTDGRIVLEALILTSSVVCALTGYTFWASKKGKDFSYLGPILFTGLIVLIMTSFMQVGLFNRMYNMPTTPLACFHKLIQIFFVMTMQMMFPVGPTSVAIYGGIAAIIFSGYIVYDTENLIKRFTYDEYIWASVTLYLDILNLFLTILRMLRQGDN